MKDTKGKNYLEKLILALMGWGCRPQDSHSDEQLILNYIKEITSTEHPEGDFILLADNSCQGCRRLIQQHLALNHAMSH